MKALIVAACIPLAACSQEKPMPVYTLYRDSPIVASARIHWATFDAADKGTPEASNKPYNQENCEYAAEILNANVRRLNGGKMPGHFWCEEGRAHDLS